MKKTILMAAMLVVAGASGYYFNASENNAKGDALPIVPSDISAINIEVKALSKLLKKQQEVQAKRMDNLVLEQTKINTFIADLAYQINSVEGDIATGIAAFETDNEIAEVTEPSEADLTTHIDRTLEDDSWDEDLTASIKAETLVNLKNAPGVDLDGIRCASSICRAKFVTADGKKPNIDEMWGTPPLMKEGFTVEQDDGSLVLYFSEGDASLEEVSNSLQDEQS